MTSELGQRLGFTIGALLVYRLGTYIPLPGIDSAAWAQIFRSAVGRRCWARPGFFRAAACTAWPSLRLGLTPLSFRRDHRSSSLRSWFLGCARCQAGASAAAARFARLHHLSHHRPCRCSNPLASRAALEWRAHASSSIPGSLFRLTTVAHAHRRDGVPGLACRADHDARHRQWAFADPVLSASCSTCRRRLPACSNLAASGALSSERHSRRLPCSRSHSPA